MNIDNLRELDHLSVSGINDYIECGLLYKFSRIDKVKPEYKSDALEFGRSIHKVLAEFNQERLIGNILSIDELHQLFDKYWKESALDNTDIKYRNGNNFNILLEEGKNLLTAYYDNIPNDNYTVIAIEEPFSFNISNIDIPIIGVIDLIEIDNTGSIIITDYKTASKAYSTNEVDKNLQLTVYNMAARANGYSNNEILLKFDVLIKTKVPKYEQYYTSRTEVDIARAVKKISEVSNGINHKVFIPNDTSWKCNGCSYKNHCNDWFNGGN